MIFRPVFLLTFLFVFILSSTHAQTWAWAKTGTSGSAGLVFGKAISTDTAGNSYATGYFNSGTITFGSTLLTNDSVGKNDIYLVKYDGTGTVIWAKSAGGKGNDQGLGISADRFGNVYLCGSFDSPTLQFGATTLTNANPGSNDLFLVKYDGSGNVLWANTKGGIGSEEALGVSADRSGHVVITGDFSSASLIFGTDTIRNASGNANVFLAAYDNTGNALWALGAGGTQPDFGNAVCTDTTGNICITGSFASPSITFGSTLMHNAGTANIFIAKYSSTGTFLWAKNYGSAGHDEGNGVSSDVYGEFFICGTFSSSAFHIDSTATLSNSGSSNIFLIKMDGLGRVKWAHTAGGASMDEGNAVCSSRNGSVFICGSFDSFYVNVGTAVLNNSNPGTYDAFVAEYDGLGNVLFAKSVGGSGNDNARGIGLDKLANAYVTGDFTSASVNFGSAVVNSSSTQNMFAAGMSGINGVENLSGNGVGLNVYPNPSSGLVNFEWKEILPNTVVFILYDPTGRVLKRVELTDVKSFQMQGGNLTPGLYLYTLSGPGSGMLTRGKVIISR
jgi:hypothetical protein